MEFLKTKIQGLIQIQPSPNSDNRGLFARTFCEKTFQAAGLETHFPQCSTSFNTKAATLRGMHFQDDPYSEIKVIRCTRGKIFDVIVDVRKNSQTYLQWQGFELSAENRLSLYVPAGCAHGFQTLEDASEVYYMISREFHADSARGLRWNDPKLKITWPQTTQVISDRDQSWPTL